MRFMLFFLVIEKVATVKLATVRIAAASLITPLYLPGDTNVHPHHVPKLVSPKWHLGWFSRFAGLASIQADGRVAIADGRLVQLRKDKPCNKHYK